MRRIKVGVVGLGVGVSHIEAFRALPDCYEVVALCDIDKQRAHKIAKSSGIQGVDTNLHDLLTRDLDLIDICTPSMLHFKQAAAALRAGFNVLLEKPVAQSLSELDELAEIEKQTNRFICPVFQYRFGQGIQKLHYLIRSGYAGKPLIATAETHWYRKEEYYSRGDWRGTWDGELGGCFTTHAIHIHDLLCEVLGHPTVIHAQASNSINGNETEDTGVMSLSFANGAIASSSVTLGARQQTSRLRFCFENLVAESGLHPYNPGHEPWTFPDDDADSIASINSHLQEFTPEIERFPGLFKRLHTAMESGSPLPVSLTDARRSIELLTAAYWSIHSGEPVHLPLDYSHPFYNGWTSTMKESSLNG